MKNDECLLVYVTFILHESFSVSFGFAEAIPQTSLILLSKLRFSRSHSSFFIFLLVVLQLLNSDSLNVVEVASDFALSMIHEYVE